MPEHEIVVGPAELTGPAGPAETVVRPASRQATLVHEVVRPAEGPPQVVEIHHEHPFDCETDVHMWQTRWPHEQQVWCCTQYYDGCKDERGIVVFPPPHERGATVVVAGRGSPHVHTATVVVAGRGSQYDCKADLPTWVTSWSDDKKAYCCTQYYDGCPDMGHRAGGTVVVHEQDMGHRAGGTVVVHEQDVVHADQHYDCEAGIQTWATSWSGDKKAYCCKYYYDGCPDEGQDGEQPVMHPDHFVPREQPYDCRADIATFATSWSDGKKAYCCTKYYDGCPEHGGHFHPAHPGHHFDCMAGVASWEKSWSQGKKDYCCKVFYNGCPASQKFDCEDNVLTWKTTWGAEKKEWCCSHHHIGCVKKELEEIYPQYDCHHTSPKGWDEQQRAWCCAAEKVGCEVDLGEVAFDCAAARANFLAAWSEMKKAWCCVNHGISCPPPPTTTTPFTSGPPTTTTPFGPKFDCKADFASWRTSWSYQKQEWCCKRTGKGCPKITTTTPFMQGVMTSTTAFPIKPQMEQQAPGQFDCFAGYANWKSGWSIKKMEWCCKNHGKGCQEMTTTTPFPLTGQEEKTTTSPFPITERVFTTTTPFANANFEGGSANLQETTTTPFANGAIGADYNCHVDFFNWAVFWSADKKDWCCANQGVGCDKNAHALQPGETSTTPFMAPFDCEAGQALWEKGWSDRKKAWCCKVKGKGCPQETSTTPFPRAPSPGPEAEPEETTTTPFPQPVQSPSPPPPQETTTTPFPLPPSPAASSKENSVNPFGGIPGWGRPQQQETTTTPFPPQTTQGGAGAGAGAGFDFTTTPWPSSADVVVHHSHGSAHLAVSGGSIHAGVHVAGVHVSAHGGSGGAVQVSSNCKEAVQFIESDVCDPEVLLASIKRTCPAEDGQASEEACRAWFGSVIGMSEANRKIEVQRCVDAVRRAVQVGKRMAHVEPSNEEERGLCFKCQLTCKVKAAPKAPVIESPGSHFPPDGSENHCRPRNSQGQASGVQMRRRVEASMMTAAQWSSLTSALNKMKAKGKIAEYARTFQKGMPPDDPTFMNFQLLPWYRRFIFEFETEMQVAAEDCDLMLPYWSACSEASPEALFSSDLWAGTRLGGRPQCQDGGSTCDSPRVDAATKCPSDPSRWCLEDGIAAGWKVEGGKDECGCVNRSPGSPNARPATCAALLPVLRLTEDFKSLAEGIDAVRAILHCGGAAGAKSTLCHQDTAVFDPLVWLDYAFMDRLFFSWQRHHYLVNDIDTTDCYGCEMHLTFYDEPLKEWFGKHDAERQCILLPKSHPVACVSYGGSYDYEQTSISVTATGAHASAHVSASHTSVSATTQSGAHVSASVAHVHAAAHVGGSHFSVHGGKASGNFEAQPGSPVPEGGWDCNAGYAMWKLGWSAAKKEWCCKTSGKGCKPS